MKQLFSLLSLLLALTFLTSCSSVEVDAGQEAVLIKKPIFFGHGGVDEAPIQTGREFVAWTTDSKIFSVVPTTKSEKFDNLMSDDNTPVDISVDFQTQIIAGKTPELLSKFGEQWYTNSVESRFRALIRDKASSYKMFDLTSNREVLVNIEQDVLSRMKKFMSDTLHIPVQANFVTIGSVVAPEQVLEETERTAAQNQNILTQEARTKAETSRREAEIAKAGADRAYMEKMNMSNSEYMRMRQIEISKEKVELLKNHSNATVIFSEGDLPTSYPVGK
jgi:hypothetical protein